MSGACAIPETPWVVRPFEADDEGCVVSMWLKSYARSYDVKMWLERRRLDPEMANRWFRPTTHGEDLRQQEYYWRYFQPMVVGLARGCETRVLCDPERVHYEPGKPACILGWACVSPMLVHYVSLKPSTVRAGFDIASEMVADLLADRLDGEMTYTWELYELKKLNLQPRGWKYDGRWMRGMQDLSLFARTYERVTDEANIVAMEEMRARGLERDRAA